MASTLMEEPFALNMLVKAEASPEAVEAKNVITVRAVMKTVVSAVVETVITMAEVSVISPEKAENVKKVKAAGKIRLYTFQS